MHGYYCAVHGYYCADLLSREGDVGAWVLLCGAWVLLWRPIE